MRTGTQARSIDVTRNKGATIVFSLIFIAAGLAIFCFFTVKPVLRWQAASSWEEVTCQIDSSQVGSHRSDDGTTYSVDIKYHYDWEGETYHGDRYNFMGGSSSGRAAKLQIVEQYPEGESAICYVDPDSPDQAVLSREFSKSYLIGLIGLVFAGAGLAIFSARNRNQMRQTMSSPGTVEHQSGPVKLESKQTPGKKVLTILFIAIFWNGVVITMFLTAGSSLFVKLFLSLFGLIGLLLCVGVVHSFLALWNPRPMLSLDSGCIPLGGMGTLHWTLQGSPQKLARFSMALEGRESVTYRRGTQTGHATNTFARVPILETDSPADMATGQAQFVVPEFSMHSFSAPNNQVTWYITVHGDIPRWPDIKDEYPIQITPPAPLEETPHAHA